MALLEMLDPGPRAPLPVGIARLGKIGAAGGGAAARQLEFAGQLVGERFVGQGAVAAGERDRLLVGLLGLHDAPAQPGEFGLDQEPFVPIVVRRVARPGAQAALVASHRAQRRSACAGRVIVGSRAISASD